ncbi:MAG: cobalamin biosynthesis protein P47K, partial [Novipirellula sp. JB048]
TATSASAFELDELILEIVDRLRVSLAEAEAETAHLKAIGISDNAHGVANLVSSDSAAVLSLASASQPKSAEVVVNARVAIDPAELQLQVEAAVQESCRPRDVQVEIRQTQSFRPGRPVPTHRVAQSEL